MALTRKQFKKGFAKSFNELARILCAARDASSDKSEWRIPFMGAVLIFPRRR